MLWSSSVSELQFSWYLHSVWSGPPADRKLVSCNDFTVVWRKFFHSLNFQIHFDYFEGTEKLFLSATILIKLLIIKLGTCRNFWWDSQSWWRRARLPRWREGESVGGRSRGRRDRDCSSGPRESRTTTRENNLHIFLVHWINFDLITKIDIWILSDWLVKINKEIVSWPWLEVEIKDNQLTMTGSRG